MNLSTELDLEQHLRCCLTNALLQLVDRRTAFAIVAILEDALPRSERAKIGALLREAAEREIAPTLVRQELLRRARGVLAGVAGDPRCAAHVRRGDVRAARALLSRLDGALVARTTVGADAPGGQR